MRATKRLALLGLAVLLLVSLPALLLPAERLAEQTEGRMKNVWLAAGSPAPVSTVRRAAAEQAPAAETPALPASEDADALFSIPASAVMESLSPDEIRETTISGGLILKNETEYDVDVGRLLLDGPSLRLPAEGAQILILHTHASEAYTQAGLDRYEANDVSRTADTEFNIVRVGDELTALLEQAGLRVIHDREIYDYPSYTGSYTRSGAAVERILQEHPEIAVVIDMHRDALGANGVVYKTMAEEDGTVASQVMLLAGSDGSGLEHPAWRENLALALYLQDAVGRVHPTLMRPVALVNQRYNQHLRPGFLILEVGSSGNTLQEALAAIRLFAEGAAPALLKLVEGSEDA